ncbi:MAG: hypothetical protein LH610_10880 [Sphingomonas bacterium]|nr:hypothetical protein [Sphingomonas bacterium]
MAKNWPLGTRENLSGGDDAVELRIGDQDGKRKGASRHADSKVGNEARTTRHWRSGDNAQQQNKAKERDFTWQLRPDLLEQAPLINRW